MLGGVLRDTKLQLLAIMVLGIVQAQVVSTVWAYIAPINPIGHYILTKLSSSFLFYPTLFTHDLIISFLLFMPSAILLSFILPLRLTYQPYLFGAVIYFWSYHVTAHNFGLPIFIEPAWAFSVAVLLLLPACLIHFIRRTPSAA